MVVNVYLVKGMLNWGLTRSLDTTKEKKTINIEDIRKKLYDNVQKLNNVRNIKNIIEELIGIELVKNILEGK